MSSVEGAEDRADSVSKRRLLEAATSYLEEFGLDGFSLRAFGAYAHLHNTAIYAHYPSKDALLAAVFDSLSGASGESVGNEYRGPVEQLRLACLELRSSLRQHPGLVPAFIESTRQPTLRNSQSLFELVLAVLEKAAVPESKRLDAARLLETYVLGSTFYDFAAAPVHLVQRGGRHLALEDEAMQAANRTPGNVDSTNEAAFAWGLDALLHSLELTK